MLNARPSGRGAAARKYDLITALGSHALSLGKGEQRTVLRLITLITGRYNWSRNELAVGQREIARMWSCNERTVKREMARLRATGWLVVRRQGARGRVTEYGIDIDRILDCTREIWPAVGPDFALRLDGASEPPDGTVLPFPSRSHASPPDLSAGNEWAMAQGVLYHEDPAAYGAWIGALSRVERAGGRLVLKAPSRFHAAYVQTHFAPRLLQACRAVDETVDEVSLTI